MWYEISHPEDLLTPSLAVFPDRIETNISRMLAMVASPSQLCPHVKTHKTTEVLQLYLNQGIRQFKCATISELEMVAMAGADFAMLAMPCVGPHAKRLVNVANKFPNVEVAVIVDSMSGVTAVASAAKACAGVDISIALDIDNGMGRTGIRCGEDAAQLYHQISKHSRLKPIGLHVYDGHIHDRDPLARRAAVEGCMDGVLEFRDRLRAAGEPVSKLITGGTPSFPIHAAHPDRICSPGTPVFWDVGYAESFPDLDFLHAAVLICRVISKLPERRYCVDLGYKSVAAEMSPPRTQFLNTSVIAERTHSEEHLVIEISAEANELQVGDLLYAIPRHICPTVARHEAMLVVQDRRVRGSWRTTARDRMISC